MHNKFPYLYYFSSLGFVVGFVTNYKNILVANGKSFLLRNSSLFYCCSGLWAN